ncbi:MAG: thiamine-monophosphate kinase [Candidatus Omnitrophota bacterium]
MNELKLINWLRSLKGQKDFDLGDDAAYLPPMGKRGTLWTTDILIENVHFTRKQAMHSWGHKAIMVNASDIAAMGGAPKWALVSMGIPTRFTLNDVKNIYKGIKKASAEFDIRIIGGDTCRSKAIVLSIAMGGLPGKHILSRKGAKPGDYVFVSGPLGDSLKSGHHLNFKARVDEAIFLNDCYHPSSMMDVSDGLSKDLMAIAHESQVGFELNEAAIPLRNKTASVNKAFEDGEDFELLFTLSPKKSLELISDKRVVGLGFNFFPMGSIKDQSKGYKLRGVNGKIKKIPEHKDHHF